MLVSIGSYDICDGTLAGGFAIGQLRYQVDRQIEVVIPLDSVDPDTFDRGGRRSTISFTVQRVHSSAGAAEEFIVGLDQDLPSSGEAELTLTSGITFLIPNAKVTQHNSSQIGATSTTTYTIVGGRAPGSGSGSGP